MSTSQLSFFDTSALGSSQSNLYWGELPGDRALEEAAAAAQQVAKAPAPIPAVLPKVDFALTGTRGLAQGWKERARDNLAAIRLLATLEAEDRNASADEQAVLARFTGFGAGELANSLFPRAGETFRAGWEEIGSQLEELTSQQERAGLARATQYAHYTPELIVHAMWDLAAQMGFRGGRALEPGCGTGLFMASVPPKLAPKTAWTAIENDPLTARITRKLFPNQWVRSEDFTTAKLAERYDLVIGNPPFSNRTVRGTDELGRLGLSLHDYFIARSISRLRPGALAMFVTSRWTMDKSDAGARRTIFETADFVGGARLPAGAMRDDAGTDVVVDVLVFRRRAPGEDAGDATWLDVAALADTDQGEGPLRINRYFAENGQQVLGRHDWTSGQFGPEYTCKANPLQMLDEALPLALGRLSSLARFPAPQTLDVATVQDNHAAEIGTAADGALLKEGSYLLHKGVLHQIIDGETVLVKVKKGEQKGGIFQKHAAIIKGLIPVRDAARLVLRAQVENLPYSAHQADLKRAYQAFARQFGAINLTNTTTRVDEETGEEKSTQRRPNLQPFYDDPDVWLVSSIEEYDEKSQTGRPGPIFSERVIQAPSEPEVHGAHDALAVSLHETGGVDVERMAELLGRPGEEVLAELGSSVYLDPVRSTGGREVWVTADEALSGAVRTKLAQAREAAERDRRYLRNVAALEEVQPEDLRPSDITARLGAPWIPVPDVEAFVAEVMGVRTTIHHTMEVATWSVDKSGFSGKAEATSVWGTQRRHAGDLLDDALNQASPKIWDTWRDVNGEHRELNTKETEAAKEKLAAIKTAFETWVWQDTDRAERLVRLYNDAFNNLVPRTFDGSHLKLPGASTAISLRDHQKRVIWRIIAKGSTYMAHAVGSGKTFSMCAAVMEQKRLGLISKGMIVVPGHCLAQMAREFMMLYPNAQILVADETNFVKDKRQRFLARAATGNWDAIVITHDAFKFVPVESAFEQEMVEDQIASYESLLENVNRDDRLSRKRIERLKEGMEAKLKALSSRKDDLVHLGEIGVDQILVDEAQQFRKLSFGTNQSDLKGIDPNGSQRAWDLFVKTRYLAKRNPERVLVMASGSPITNTLGEMFSIQRFMDLPALVERGLHEFDAWAASFGETRTELELQPSGLYKPVTRFSEFVNVADLMAMYCDFADVVQQDDLRRYVKLPEVAGGRREIVVADSGDAFREYQKTLAERIKTIEERTGKPQKGDDILLSVITDALHHLDVPWLVSDIIQREGRIERQGNQNPVIQLYAYALKGSVDATNWQMLERKQKFICLAMSGDRTIRRLEDVGAEANQFAMAKALASGDERLMQKAGLKAELARLERLQAAHHDDQYNVRRAIDRAERDRDTAQAVIPRLQNDIAKREPTRGEAFRLVRKDREMTEREKAGQWLLSQARLAAKAGEKGKWTLGTIGGFEILCETWRTRFEGEETWDATLGLVLDGRILGMDFDRETSPVGLVSRTENALLWFEAELADARRQVEEAERKLPGYRARVGLAFPEAGLLQEKREAMAALEADLAADTQRREEAEKAEAKAALEAA
ncbi:DEAD/DEAH box helicase family protein [Gluconobacter cerinus]|uniref:DEAD/DEAH box helicase family protein n=1 Tax=Gluconobacter cerinus TaxID=38307 RepID=UPI001B8D95E0|nr:DEAD/DEAH box helicase family protein [Gluconobacter cerinus]MBS1038878.1 DEAD/DEAH box helicase family protein [Gluconobacter cerinus]